MALTNILREPRRELIEQGMGAVAIIGLVTINLTVAATMCLLIDGTILVPLDEFAAADFLGILATVAFIALLFFMHALGEGVCNVMAQRGRDPRPKRRTA